MLLALFHLLLIYPSWIDQSVEVPEGAEVGVLQPSQLLPALPSSLPLMALLLASVV
jgi:hypothetical protein